MQGWKVLLPGENSRLRYDKISFEGIEPASVNIKYLSATGGKITIRLDKPDGSVIASIQLSVSGTWEICSSSLNLIPAGIHDIYIATIDTASVDIDWISFE
jgi:hypothetical protein